MIDTIKNMLDGVSGVLDLSGRDPSPPIEFNVRTYTYRGAVKEAMRADAAKIHSDMCNAFHRVVPTDVQKK